jgi:hypothetical protein
VAAVVLPPIFLEGKHMRFAKLIPTLTILTAMSICTSALAEGGQRHLKPDAVAAAKALAEIQHSDGPEKAYAAFNEFARTHFGAETDDLIYEKFGHDLKLIETGKWRHVSENSAAVAWETNLPAESYVEYGLTTDYGQQTEKTDRPYYLHMHHIKGLQQGKTYHYRLVAVDERGNKLTSPDQTLTTEKVANAVYLPGDLEGPPYRLTKSDTTYILTEDIKAPATAIIVDRLTENVTVDLNGHTVTFAEADLEGDDAKRTYGIRCNVTTNVKIVNGTVSQGGGKALAANRDSYNFNNLLLVGNKIELAGVKAVYHAPQAWGVRMDRYLGEIQVHHNVFKDMGTKVTNRHGAGQRVFGGRDGRGDSEDVYVHHNLVQRARQNGMSGHNMYSNEFYVDSWSTNSFTVQSGPSGNPHHNRIFATGFNPYGFGWGTKDLILSENFVYMVGLDTTHRWGERWGDVNLLAAMRITNYGKGGQVRDNLQFNDNLIIMRARGDSEIQGTRFYSDTSITNTVFRNNVVKAEVLDDKVRRAACIVPQGHFRKADSVPIEYIDNRLISNICMIQFGCPYGKGNNHHFIRTKFERVGDNPDFHTFVFDGRFWNFGHVILDGEFGPGTSYDDVYWRDTGTQSYYSVAWTLTLQTEPGADITVKDVNGKVEFTGKADDKGVAQIPLTHCEIRPLEWKPDTDKQPKLEAKDKHQKVMKTPHTVQVGDSTAEVTMDKPKSMTLR